MAISNQLVSDFYRETISDVKVGDVFRYSNPYGYLAFVADTVVLMKPTPNGFDEVQMSQFSLLEVAGGDPVVVNFVGKENLINYLNQRQSFKVDIEMKYAEPERASRRALGSRGDTYIIDSYFSIVSKRREEVFNPNESEIVFRYELVTNAKNKAINCLIQFDESQVPKVKVFDSNEYLEWYLKSNTVTHKDLNLTEYHRQPSVLKPVSTISE
ncbi:hypothetical protein SP15_287 [Bacillus phage SP-15]|uniref:Uncharacterized protein n=1 Tax=Bacillus phage SP-15 TaxID=1792032 RepID=A0A127AWR6_9CAUD|nr:hypothetical protein SP15_287 [Bacillus phage SP-15]AMM45095.1 hypothetical protein SP15_287 [Bacillus phage SP-15]